jgi:molybdopterin synthase sulfur carrier subunit
LDVATVRFTANIQRHVECPAREVSGASVREAMNAYFAVNERARTYVLDEAGELRKHMVVFVDGRAVRDRAALSDPVTPTSTIDVMQALSGG